MSDFTSAHTYRGEPFRIRSSADPLKFAHTFIGYDSEGFGEPAHQVYFGRDPWASALAEHKRQEVKYNRYQDSVKKYANEFTSEGNIAVVPAPVTNSVHFTHLRVDGNKGYTVPTKVLDAYIEYLNRPATVGSVLNAGDKVSQYTLALFDDNSWAWLAPGHTMMIPAEVVDTRRTSPYDSAYGLNEAQTIIDYLRERKANA